MAIVGIKQLPAQGGADRVVERLLERASPALDITVYLLRTPQIALHCTERRHYIYAPAWGGKHLRPFVYFGLCTVHALVKGRYDIVHVHNSDVGLFCALLRLRPRQRVLGTFHGDPYLRAKWGAPARAFLRLSERCFAQFCHRLTSVSRFKTRAQGLWSSRSVEYIPNGVDPVGDGSAAAVDWQALGVEPGRFLLFACGRLDVTKGLHHLLAAYARVRPAEPLLVIGDFSHDRDYSRRIQHEATAVGNVLLHPRLLPREQLLRVLARCRLFVFPSEVEAMSMMLLEAISCSAPVVCSDIPENLAVVGEGYRYACSLQAPDALADMLAAALADAKLPSYAQSLQQDVARRFEWGAIQARYAAIYDALRFGAPAAGVRS